MSHEALAIIRRELDVWHKAGRIATLWWRDDDAHAASPALKRLLKLCDAHSVPCCLAAIPARIEDSLVHALQNSPHAWVLQHGFAHENHASQGQGLGAWELGLHRPLEAVLKELASGKKILETRFGQRFIPVVVPPWNRIEPALLKHFPDLGLIGLSAEEDNQLVADAVRIVPAHADLLRWKGGTARFAGAMKVAGQLVGNLRARRTGTAEQNTPTGVLTHHLEMDEAAWDFMAALLKVTATHPASRWLPAPEVFTPEDVQ